MRIERWMFPARSNSAVFPLLSISKVDSKVDTMAICSPLYHKGLRTVFAATVFSATSFVSFF